MFSYCRKEYETTDEKMLRQYQMLIQKIDQEGPFTAMDFFKVDKTTVTTACSTIITYLIILIQFDLC